MSKLKCLEWHILISQHPARTGMVRPLIDRLNTLKWARWSFEEYFLLARRCGVLTPVLLLLFGSVACERSSPTLLDLPRLTRGRLSLDHSHRVCEAQPDGIVAWECHFTLEDRVEFFRAVGRMLDEAPAPPEAYRSRLLLAVLRGRERDFLSETAQLENSEALNDRAVLLRSLAEREGRPDFLPLAFEAAYQAKEVTPSNRRVRFNLVQLLAELGLREQARNNATQLLEDETDAGWRSEIEAVLKTGAAPPGPVETSWLPPHYILTEEDAEMARRILEVSSQLGTASPADCGSVVGRGAMVSGLLRETIQALCRGPNDRRLPLARTIVELAGAFSLGDRSLLAESLKALESAAAKLGRLRSPLATLASVESAAILYNQGDRITAKSRLESALAGRDCTRHEVLCSRVGWLLGMTLYVTGSREEGGALLESTARFYDQYDRPALSSIVNALTADAYKPLGNDLLTWRALERALRSLPRIRQPIRAMQVLNIAADVARFGGHQGLALHFQKESLSVALRTGDPSLKATAENWLALLEYRAGNLGAAQWSLATAQRLAPEVRDPGRRRMVEAETSLVEGLLLVDQDPERALKPLGVAADYYSRRNHVFSTVARRALARSLRTLGRVDAALEQLHSTIEYLEGVQRGTRRDSLTLTLASSWQGPFDEAVSIFLGRGERTEALLMSERSRMLSMRSEGWNAVGSAGGKTRIPSVQQLQDSVPKSTAVVCLEALDEGIVSWTITRNSLTFDWTEIDAELLDATLSNVESLDGTDASYLSRVLVEPWIDRIPETTHLVLVPDRELEKVPFARLRAGSRAFLVDRNSFEVALTLTGWREGLSERLRPGAELRPGIIVAHGDEDDAVLQFVADEVEAVEEIAGGTSYIREHELQGGAGLVEFVARQQAVHIAGHALSDPQGGPRIVLGDAKGPDLEFRPSTLRELPLGEVFLVTLSACSTHLPGVDREEVASLARPMLLSGVSVVGATLWNIRDEVAHDFYVGFFEELARGAAVEMAFSLAQRRLRQRPDLSPSDWAAFQLMTGGLH